jgi:salicylate hydroxylase
MRVPRQVLRQLMLDRVKSPVHWGNRLITFEPGTENIRLQFDNNTTTEVDLLVGADGIRSSVVQRLEQENGLRYLSIMIILGIADFLHPLLDERGFYTLDGTHRLFTMPYEGSKLSTKRRTMWQLSYRLHDEQEAKRLSAAGPEALREEVLRRCHNWHQPVPDMIAATPLETIWGT